MKSMSYAIVATQALMARILKSKSRKTKKTLIVIPWLRHWTVREREGCRRTSLIRFECFNQLYISTTDRQVFCHNPHLGF